MADKVVPEIPTQEMLRAAAGCYTLRNDPAPEFLAKLWRAMHDAAPAAVAPEAPRTVAESAKHIASGQGATDDHLRVFGDPRVGVSVAAPAEAPREGNAQGRAGFATPVGALCSEHTAPSSIAAPAEAPPAEDALTHALKSIAASYAVRADIRNTVAKAAARIESDAVRIRALEADAKRYRFLRRFWIHARHGDPDGAIAITASADGLDAIIDRALASPDSAAEQGEAK